jgi:hypothetical protein
MPYAYDGPCPTPYGLPLHLHQFTAEMVNTGIISQGVRSCCETWFDNDHFNNHLLVRCCNFPSLAPLVRCRLCTSFTGAHKECVRCDWFTCPDCRVQVGGRVRARPDESVWKCRSCIFICNSGECVLEGVRAEYKNCLYIFILIYTPSTCPILENTCLKTRGALPI